MDTSICDPPWDSGNKVNARAYQNDTLNNRECASGVPSGSLVTMFLLFPLHGKHKASCPMKQCSVGLSQMTH